MSKEGNKLLFWGCFVALITTAFGFISRMFLVEEWSEEFGLDPAQAGRLMGIGIWPFAVSIIGFSLFIDRIGYKVSMFIAFAGHLIWGAMAVAAYFISNKGEGDPETAFQLIYWGSLILALANGTVEAFINPVVATMFSKEKTKWLNILHAGWPGGLVIAGMILIFMGDAEWYIKVGVIVLPAIVYFFMLIGCSFPVSERVEAGVSYRDMLKEFGFLGALVVGFLVALQLMDFASVGSTIELSVATKGIFWAIGAAIVLAFTAYTRAPGSILMFVLILIMMPLATTEIGTDGWITGIMEGIAKENNFHPGWILVYTSAIMMVLRFFAGPIVHSLSPLGLLAISAVLAIVGLYTLSFTTGMMIFAAATLYGVGKTFFWPTMLGVVAEQTPKGGALTLNAISGIGMLAVGTLGFPYIGTLQSDTEIPALAASDEAKAVPGLVVDGNLSEEVLKENNIYEIIRYEAIDGDALTALVQGEGGETDESKETLAEINNVRDRSKQGALANMTVFPMVMLLGYIGLIAFFVSRGGYKAKVLAGHDAEDGKFTGGVEGPADM